MEKDIVIKRTRWVILRKNRTEILVGLDRDFYFKPIDALGDTIIKSYSSVKKAQSSFLRSWGDVNFNYEIIPVVEEIHSNGVTI